MRNPNHPINQKAGPMADRRTRRKRSRAEAERAAIDEQLPKTAPPPDLDRHRDRFGGR